VAPTAFSEGYVDAGALRVRYLQAGQGRPLVHLQSGGGLRLTPAHELLCRRFRVVLFEVPGGPSPADTLVQAVTTLGLDTFDLMASSFGTATALRLALREPRRVRALALEAPAAIRTTDRDADLERQLPSLATPTLVVFGTRDDAVPPAMGRVYKELIPDAHLVYVYEAGHTISTDRPEAFAEVVVDFLERHDAFVISRARTVIHP
jgi:pimeloyl-ACP methyl ester carboxylesterase